MGELLERFGGTSCALAPDDAEPGMEMAAPELVRLAYFAAAKTVLNMLLKRAPAEFAVAVPALEALLVEVEEVRQYTGSLWELPGGLKPRHH
jgi:hypothetical protein